MSTMIDYLDGKKNMLIQIAWRLKGMHDLKGSISEKAFEELTKWIRVHAMNIDADYEAFQGTKDAQSRISNIFDDEVDE